RAHATAHPHTQHQVRQTHPYICRPPLTSTRSTSAFCPRTLAIGPSTLAPGPWTLALGPWTLDFGPWTLDFGPWTLDFGPWTLDFGPWTLDLGLCTVTPLMNRLGRVLQFFRPDADRLAVVALFLLLGIGANLLKPWPLAIMIHSVLGDHPVPMWLRALSSPTQKGKLLILLSSTLLLLHLGQSALSSAQNYLAIQVGLSGLRRVRNEVFACLQRLS